MNFFEQELQKIINPCCSSATYVGRACYVRLSEQNMAKIQFVAGDIANQYNAIQIKILNRSEGVVDTLRLRFADLLGRKQVNNPNFSNGIMPYIWDYCGDMEWYVYKPNAHDYTILAQAVNDYLAVFQEQSPQNVHAENWEQTML